MYSHPKALCAANYVLSLQDILLERLLFILELNDVAEENLINQIHLTESTYSFVEDEYQDVNKNIKMSSLSTYYD